MTFSKDGIGSLSAALVLAATATATFAVVAVASTATATATTNKKRLSKGRLWLAQLVATATNTSLVLENVRVPVAVVQDLVAAAAAADVDVVATADEEGLCQLNIRIRAGRIVAVDVASTSERGSSRSSGSAAFFSSVWIVNCGGAILMPCFYDAHSHMVKTETVPRNRNESGTMSEAMFVNEISDWPRYKQDSTDVYRRMEFAAKCAIHHGSRAIRTHLDGTANFDDPEVQQIVFDAFDAIRDKYQAELTIQGVANLYLPLWSDSFLALPFAERAKSHDNTVLGAYCGNNAETPDEETIQHLVNLFRIAQQLENMDVDMHMDESNDPSCCTLRPMCIALAQARNSGYSGRVVLGHCCALSLQEPAVQQDICRKLAALGNVYVVANPFTNLGLQDRSGSTAPLSKPIPKLLPRTPQWRGVTCIQELRAAGVPTAAASDNVRDHWYSYGDYDMLAVWSSALQLAHLDTAPCAGAWADLVTTAPARAMGLFENEAANQADLVLFPSARRCSELFARPQTDRIVLRSGLVQYTYLPEFAILDDLVSTKTKRVQSSF
jgi:cytosine deaminase